MTQTSKVPPPRSTPANNVSASRRCKPIRNRHGSRLIDDPLDDETRLLGGLAHGVALRVVEVRRHGHDAAMHRHPERALGVGAQCVEHVRR
jgi:hypothetical protein